MGSGKVLGKGLFGCCCFGGFPLQPVLSKELLTQHGSEGTLCPHFILRAWRACSVCGVRADFGGRRALCRPCALFLSTPGKRSLLLPPPPCPGPSQSRPEGPLLRRGPNVTFSRSCLLKGSQEGSDAPLPVAELLGMPACVNRLVSGQRRAEVSGTAPPPASGPEPQTPRREHPVRWVGTSPENTPASGRSGPSAQRAQRGRPPALSELTAYGCPAHSPTDTPTPPTQPHESAGSFSVHGEETEAGESTGPLPGSTAGRAMPGSRSRALGPCRALPSGPTSRHRIHAGRGGSSLHSRLLRDVSTNNYGGTTYKRAFIISTLRSILWLNV